MKLQNYCFGLIIFFLAACVEPLPLSSEKKIQELLEFNERNGPYIQKDMQGYFYLNLPEQKDKNKKVSEKNKTKLFFPYEIKPEIDFQKYTDKRTNTIYIHFKLENLTKWDVPPPIPFTVAEHVRMYSSFNKLFGKKPETVQDPKVRNRLYEQMKWARANKRVRFQSGQNTFSTYNELKYDAFFYKSNYVFDGMVSGLQRFSKQRCYSKGQLMPDPNEPRYKGYLSRIRSLENKAPDDPSPQNCVVKRLDSILISPSSAPKSDWVYIECRPVLRECTAKFEAALRLVEVDFFYKDLELWRETVDPIRANINSYMN